MTPNQSKIRITKFQFTGATEEQQETGLLGWVSCVYEGHLKLAGIAVRRTLDGRTTLAFPVKDDAAGNRRYVFRPLDDESRREIERAIFAWLPAGVTRREV